MPLLLITAVSGRYLLFFIINSKDKIRIVGRELDFRNIVTLEGCY
jgi:hypothetical protein